MTADSSHNDGFGPKGSRRVPHSTVARAASKGSTPNLDVWQGEPDADLEFDPTLAAHEPVDFESMLPPLELSNLEPTLRPLAASEPVDPPPTLAPETPLPRCLTDAAYASGRPASRASKIPPAPKVPRFSLPAARPIRAHDEEAGPASETCLGLPTDRVLPGSPALVSTFRPKPELRSCYSVTHACEEERVFPARRAARKAKPPTKRRR